MLAATKTDGARWVLASLAALFVLGALPTRAENSGLSAEHTRQVVARALHLGAEDGSTLQVLRSPLPAGARVHLVASQIAPGGQGSLVRLACDAPADCLPFYVLVRGTEIARPEPASTHASLAPVVPVQRVGDRVDIVEQLSGLNLRTRGVCLQPGAIGDRIRVRTLTTHRVLAATIAAPNLVTVER